ncbi:MAG: hypothetical protein J6A01_07250 [Proteobacteria bacterium]|nr:hypothetical protein [Pseudomonadota bacterium]
MALFPVVGSAQAPDDPQVPQANPAKETIQVQINQPFVSKTLGNLTLPFMWEPQENEAQNRLVVTETRTHAPAVLTIDLLSLPPMLDESSMAASIIKSAASQLGVSDAKVSKTEEKTECDKKKCPKLTFYNTDFTGTENGIDRRCALSLLPAQGKMLVFTICAAPSQVYTPDLPEILSQVFHGMN